MDSMLIFLLKVSTIHCFLYIFYYFVLKKDIDFYIQRVYLICSIIVSFSIPLIRLKIPGEDLLIPEELLVFDEFFNDFTGTMANNKLELNPEINFLSIISSIYFIGALLYIARSCTHFLKLVRLMKKHKLLIFRNIRLILTDDNTSPFSFFNYVFINKSKYAEYDLESILVHEKYHSDHLHTFDLLLVEIIRIFFWFNPVILFYKRSIREVHEYLADRKVLDLGFNKIKYQRLLLLQAVKDYPFGFISKFNVSLIKKRIIMMTKTESNKYAKLRTILIIPLIALLILAFSSGPDINFVVEKLAIADEPEPDGKGNTPSVLPIKKSDIQGISSDYGMRIHPVSKKEKMHYGIDFKADKGIPVIATANGLVLKVELNHQEGKGFGKYIVIRHNEKYSTLYAQLSDYNVKEGQKVKKGDIIGHVGSSGQSTGPHLHYEVHRNDKRVNPGNYFDY